MRRVTAMMAGAAVALATVGWAASSASAGDGGKPPRLDPAALAAAADSGVAWEPCTDDLADLGLECGTLAVPLDHDRPRGRKISLALTRARHTVPDAQFQGVMLVNPGGPGGSGRVFALLQQFVPDDAGLAYDWIGFDPRGVGASSPALACDGDYLTPPRPQYDPVSPAVEKAWLARVKGYAADCGRNGGALLANLTSVDSVEDMDLIRKALGQPSINFYGYSYGTYLGQVYATLHPDRVRRMVLDSNADWRKVWYQGNLAQDPAFETVIQLWFDWIAQYDDVYHLGATGDEVEALWYATRDALGDAPAEGVVGPAEWSDVFLTPGYSQGAWPFYASLFAAYVNDGDATGIIEDYLEVNPPGDDNGYAMYLGVQCTDAPWPTDWRTWRRDNTRIAATAPFVTWGNAWFNAPCAFWPAKSQQPVKVDGRKAPAVLLLGETLDAPTPFEGSLEARRRFPQSRLVATPGGTTHANSLLGGNPCVDGTVAAYLADGTLPVRVRGNGPDATCEALPLPVPDELVVTAASARSAAAPSAEEDGELAARLRAQLQRSGR